MIERIVEYLSLKAATVAGIERPHCLAELRTDTDAQTQIPYIYSKGGNYSPVNVDGGSVSYWRLTGEGQCQEVAGGTPIKDIVKPFTFRFIAMLRRDDNNPLIYANDLTQLLSSRDPDLALQLAAKTVKVTVNKVDHDTVKIWSEEFKVPTKSPRFDRSMVAIELTVEVTASRACWLDCGNYPDILQGFPWCQDTGGTLDRLTDTQVECITDYLCEAPPPCDPATIEVNSTPTDTVASGGVYNQEIEDSGGNPVGTAANPSVVGDATVQNDATTPTWSDTVEAEGILTLPQLKVLDSDGVTPILANYIPETDGFAVTCSVSPIPSLSIEVYSDAGYTTPITTTTYNQKVYIRATPTNTSPTGYIFFAFDGVNIHPIGQQVGNEISGEVLFIGSYQIYANTLGSDTVYGSKTMTGSSDPNALLYINAHNTASSLTMADSQQLVINETYARFKGARTTNNSNLWAKLSTSNAEIYPFAPVSNSVTSLPTIAVDMVNPSTLATIVNFLSTDVKVDGVTADSTKWLVLKNQPSNFGQNDVGADVYYKTSSSTVGMYTGAYNGNMSNGVFFSPQYCGANNGYSSSNLPRVIGLLSINRDNAADFQLYYRGVQTSSITRASTTPPSLPFFGFAANTDGSPDTGYGRKFWGKLAMVANRCSFTDEELADWNEIWEYYIANIIL